VSWNSDIETHWDSLARPDVHCILSFEDNGEVWLGCGECRLEICPMIRKNHQQSFPMDRENDKIKPQVNKICTEIQNAPVMGIDRGNAPG
jgi:hypothetical protein